MTKLEIECVRNLPSQYVRDGIAVEQKNNGFVNVISHLLPILRYDPVTRKFKPHRR